jgi:hypothetical protein
MTMADDAVTRGLLRELADEEKALAEADKQLQAARVGFDVASRKYAAVRDMVASYLGDSPYQKKYDRVFAEFSFYNPGRYRFIHMKPGDAVVAVLKEAEEPMTLDEIVQELRSGHIRISEATLTRAVNAALMKTSGVKKLKDGKYRYEVDTELPFSTEELPFE